MWILMSCSTVSRRLPRVMWSETTSANTHPAVPILCHPCGAACFVEPELPHHAGSAEVVVDAAFVGSPPILVSVKPAQPRLSGQPDALNDAYMRVLCFRMLGATSRGSKEHHARNSKNRRRNQSQRVLLVSLQPPSPVDVDFPAKLLPRFWRVLSVLWSSDDDFFVDCVGGYNFADSPSTAGRSFSLLKVHMTKSILPVSDVSDHLLYAFLLFKWGFDDSNGKKDVFNGC